ncbi:MAG: ribonuclease HII [bacterium]|nr:ribonuclease HII [bacterium]
MDATRLPELTVSQIRDQLSHLDAIDEALLHALEADTRAGVRNLALRERKRRKAEAAEQARLEAMLKLERTLWKKGIIHLAGVDEAGRGPLAGPVVAAAVILPPETLILGLNDSKALTPERREALFDQIHQVAIAIAVGQATPEEIDRWNILQATHHAMRRALKDLSVAPNRVLVDGNSLPESAYPELAIIGGDASSLSIAAASVIAKVTRDRQMLEYDRQFPVYGFAQHKGYGSADHLRALKQHGPCSIHRKSFSPVSEWVQDRSDDYRLFAQGIGEARSEEQLEAIGQAIASARDDLPIDEVEDLRKRYKKRLIAFNQTGPKGERIAAQEFTKKGYQILEQGFRAAGGEIDLIARKGNILAFVEVKTAATSRFGNPESWVPPAKQRQIGRIAQAYLHAHPSPNQTLRFDVVAIHLNQTPPLVHHIENAFRLER